MKNWRFAGQNYFWFNVALTLLLVVAMVALRIDPFVVFMVGFVIAIAVNFPNLAMQPEQIDAHARAALTMAAILFAAGAFTGIMKESGMLSAMAASAIHAVPTRLAHHLPLGLAVISMPLSLLFTMRTRSISACYRCWRKLPVDSACRRCKWRRLRFWGK